MKAMSAKTIVVSCVCIACCVVHALRLSRAEDPSRPVASLQFVNGTGWECLLPEKQLAASVWDDTKALPADVAKIIQSGRRALDKVIKGDKKWSCVRCSLERYDTNVWYWELMFVKGGVENPPSFDVYVDVAGIAFPIDGPFDAKGVRLK